MPPVNRISGSTDHDLRPAGRKTLKNGEVVYEEGLRAVTGGELLVLDEVNVLRPDTRQQSTVTGTPRPFPAVPGLVHYPPPTFRQ